MIKASIRPFLFALGMVCTAFGIAGIFLPLLPGTPLLLLAALCFGYSSERMHAFLLGNRLTGPIIRDYREKRAITRKTKLVALIFLWASISYSAFFMVPLVAVRILMLAIAAGVTVFILSIRTLADDAD